jgi:hypothetical protein
MHTGADAITPWNTLYFQLHSLIIFNLICCSQSNVAMKDDSVADVIRGALCMENHLFMPCSKQLCANDNMNEVSHND